MADRPIIFSGPMVRALFDDRKTQTRRLINPQPEPFLIDGQECEVAAVQMDGEELPRVAVGRCITLQKLRYAKGDRLWVKEAISCGGVFTDLVEVRYRAHERASHTEFVEQVPASAAPTASKLPKWPKYRPSIHMPRWASRLTLPVEAVRVQRLQEISEVDAKAEGAIRMVVDEDGKFYESDAGTYVCGFAGIWQHLHGAASWDANPFVVALTFRTLKGNIDRMAA
jgi:hypothetical protein